MVASQSELRVRKVRAEEEDAFEAAEVAATSSEEEGGGLSAAEATLGGAEEGGLHGDKKEFKKRKYLNLHFFGET